MLFCAGCRRPEAQHARIPGCWAGAGREISPRGHCPTHTLRKGWCGVALHQSSANERDRGGGSAHPHAEAGTLSVRCPLGPLFDDSTQVGKSDRGQGRMSATWCGTSDRFPERLRSVEPLLKSFPLGLIRRQIPAQVSPKITELPLVSARRPPLPAPVFEGDLRPQTSVHQVHTHPLLTILAAGEGLPLIPNLHVCAATLPDHQRAKHRGLRRLR